MRLIKTIEDMDLGIDAPRPAAYEERQAARAVVFDGDKNVALLNVTRKHYHKLPGGGIEEGESIEAALRRELQEEIGCSVGNVREFGVVEEYRNKFALHQSSYCFIADVVGEKRAPKFEADEVVDGFEPEWFSLDKAIEILENETNIEDYEGKFIRLRDLTILKEIALQ